MLNVIGNDGVVAAVHVVEKTATDQSGVCGEAAGAGEGVGISEGIRVSQWVGLSEGVGHSGCEKREGNNEFHDFG